MVTHTSITGCLWAGGHAQVYSCIISHVPRRGRTDFTRTGNLNGVQSVFLPLQWSMAHWQTHPSVCCGMPV